MKKTPTKTTSNRPRFAANDAAVRLEMILGIMWDDATNDWREHASCADTIQDITQILALVVR
jgi:hypothetical protein